MVKIQRLVYAPKAYVYTKTANGTVYDLTNYVTAGQVDRKLNQVSTAQITLRNTQRKFTLPKSQSGVAFHPQDPITIYLQRLQGHPVRVFTGYLDTTPYYQLYPGTITLQASCTLKRLLYSFFDPSLPYMIAFFEQYGWVNTGQGSLISKQSFGAKQTKTTGATQADANSGVKPYNDLEDGSLGKLLWATLLNIGQWKDGNIYIEDLPTGPNGVAARMATLMQSIDQSQQEASKEFTSFLSAVIGTGSQGSGGGAAGGGGSLGSLGGSIEQFNHQYPKHYTGTSGESLPPATVAAIAQWAGLPGETFSQIARGESSFSPGIVEYPPEAGTGAQGYGLWQITTHVGNDALINSFGGPDAMLNPLINAKAAKALYDSAGHSVAPWHGTQYLTNPNAPYTGPALTSSPSGTQNNASQSIGAAHAQNAIAASGSSSQSSSTGGGTQSRIDCIIEAANVINDKHYPYVYAGGRPIGKPSVGAPGHGYDGHTIGFDCSGVVAAVLSAANIMTPGGSVGSEVDLINQLQAKGLVTSGIGQGNPSVTLWDNPSVHIFMTINGRYFGTWAPGANSPGGGGWLTGASPSGYTPYMFTQRYLNEQTTYSLTLGTGSTSGAGGSGGGGGASGVNTSAQAFVAQLQFPSIEDQVTAVVLGSEGKGFMHDQSLMPFIQQLADASLRSFQSLPNGDFYAFYPDYFGEMGHSPVYWEIDDLEILDGGINLSDEGLATHVYAVGDNSWPVNNELVNQMFSAGSISVYNAFLGDLVDTSSSGKSTASNKSGGKNKNTSAATSQDPGSDLSGNIMNAEEALKFVERYGARPLVKDYPMIRSAIYEMLVAYQQFMTAWSTQFQTPYTFTFMPEVFPGGKVGFPNHGLQMYVDEVSHQWDYTEGGFTTAATLSAPSLYVPKGQKASAVNQQLPPDMVRAMVEPVSSRKNATGSQHARPKDHPGTSGWVEKILTRNGF